MEGLLLDLRFNLLVVGALLGVFIIFVAANTIIGCIKNIGIMKEKFKWSCLRKTLLKVLGVVVAGLAGAAALTVLPKAIVVAGNFLGITEEFQTLATSVQTIGVLGLVIYLGKACVQYGKNFLDNFGELISGDSNNNGIPDGMSL